SGPRTGDHERDADGLLIEVGAVLQAPVLLELLAVVRRDRSNAIEERKEIGDRLLDPDARWRRPSTRGLSSATQMPSAARVTSPKTHPTGLSCRGFIRALSTRLR